MKTKLQYICFLLALLAGIHQAAAQGTTAFTYQGQLHDNGTNANGAYTMIFALYNAASGGAQIGSTITTSPTLANGLFTVNLDFGAGAFNGSARWLDITVQSGSDSEELSPRVQVLPMPYAQFAAVAASVTNGAIMNAQIAANAVATTNIQNGAITTMQIAAGAVTNSNLTANAVAATNIQNNAITAAKITSGQVVKSLGGLTDAVNLYAGENVSLFFNPTTGFNITNGFVIAASPIPNIMFFTTSGTFTVPYGVTKIMVEMWGGGGGGGSGYNDGTGTYGDGGGGGAGGYAMNVFNVTPGTSYSVNVGIGGAPDNNGSNSSLANSLGTLISAGGGNAGDDYPTSGGGTGGSESGSIIGFPGGPGNHGNGEDGGLGGSVWRGGGPYQEGPAGGGQGGSAGGIIGNEGNDGAIFIYY
jgi:hypothetical protein